jgi:predicted tellurium resistance membrane protein TerC
MEYLLSSAGLISLFTLTFMEIVLGIDNIIFVSIVASRVEKRDERKARNWGLIFAMIIRVLLLLVIQLVIQSQNTLFTLPIDFEGKDISLKDIMLLLGGLFLLYKSTTEIHHKFNVDEHLETEKKTKKSFSQVVMQIILINLVFSIDSIVTAIGLTESILIMFIAIITSMLIMVWVASGISKFVEEHPTVKMLALSFLLMIGCMLVIEAFEMHVPKGYIYFSMAFSLFVEMLNIRLRKKQNLLKQ